MDLQEERKLTKQAERMRIFYSRNRIKWERCVLTVCICAEAAEGGWFVALRLCNYPSCQTERPPYQLLFKEGSEEL